MKKLDALLSAELGPKLCGEWQGHKGRTDSFSLSALEEVTVQLLSGENEFQVRISGPEEGVRRYKRREWRERGEGRPVAINQPPRPPMSAQVPPLPPLLRPHLPQEKGGLCAAGPSSEGARRPVAQRGGTLRGSAGAPFPSHPDTVT